MRPEFDPVIVTRKQFNSLRFDLIERLHCFLHFKESLLVSEVSHRRTKRSFVAVVGIKLECGKSLVASEG